MDTSGRGRALNRLLFDTGAIFQAKEPLHYNIAHSPKIGTGNFFHKESTQKQPKNCSLDSHRNGRLYLRLLRLSKTTC